MKALGAYIFAGGFTVGVKRAGYEVLAHLEGGDYGVKSARGNWPDLPIHVGADFWPIEVLKAENPEGIDFVYCNPPCAVFSAMGIRTTQGPDAWRTDPRTDCWHKAFALIEKLKPRAWACESVPQAYTTGREMIDEMTKKALLQGYSVTHLLVDCKWTGIPQSRKRFFLVAHKQALLVPFPHNWAPPPTVGEALAGITDPGAFDPSPERYLILADATPPGGKLCTAWEALNPPETHVRNAQGKVTGRPSFQDHKIDPSKPMTAFVGDKYWHWAERRKLGINEMKALCGYPQDFYLEGTPSGWPSLLARAVMPSMGEWLGKSIALTIQRPEITSLDQRRVTFVDVRAPDVPPVDLTSQYIEPNGKIRFTVRAGSITPAPTPPPAQKVSSAPKEAAKVPAASPPSPMPAVTIPSSTTTSPAPAPRQVDLEEAIADRDTFEKPLSGEGSGKFIKRLWMTGRYTPEQLVALVHQNWEGRTTKVGDVYYNYQKLIQEQPAGTVPPWPHKTSRTTKTPAPAPTLAQQANPPAPEAEEQGGEALSDDEGDFSAGSALSRTPAEAITPIVSRSTAIRSTPARIAVLDWFPRICGAVDYAGHLKPAHDGIELVTASKSGQPLKNHASSFEWRTLKASDAAAILNSEYDAVLMTDVACLSPHLDPEDDSKNWNLRVLKDLRIPTTAFFHGGMDVKKKYDVAINALFSAPGFTGSIVTARDWQSQERLAAWKGLKQVYNPYYPYNPSRSRGASADVRRREVMMTARLASNKGQNAAMAVLNHLDHDVQIWGENPYGLPSIGWRLWELSQALGYIGEQPPVLRRDAQKLTHPNAKKFYTGEFSVAAPDSGARLFYRDGYVHLTDIDWSPWVHLTAYAPQFGGLLEFSILDAIHCGAIVVVPDVTLERVEYETIPTYSFTGTTLWSDEKEPPSVKGQDFDRLGMAATLNEILAKPDDELADMAAAQRVEIGSKHAPDRAFESVLEALRGEGT